MKTISVTTYSFNELSPEAQEVAMRYEASREYDDAWGTDRLSAYKQAKEYYERIGENGISGEMSGARLYTWIINNLSSDWIKPNFIAKHEGGAFSNSPWQHKYHCVKKRRSRIFVTNELENCHLTGVCYDMDFLQPIIDFLKKPDGNITNIDLSESMPGYDSIYNRDFDDYYEDAQVRERLEDSDNEFLENGNLYLY